jgi:hypothetical protein
MPDKLTPADPQDVANSISFALRFHGRKRFHEGEKLMAEITADHILRHLERCRFVLLKRPPLGGRRLQTRRRAIRKRGPKTPSEPKRSF